MGIHSIITRRRRGDMITLTNDMLINPKLMGEEVRLINQPASLVLDALGNPDQLVIPIACGTWYLQPIGQRTCFTTFDAPRVPIDPDQPWPAEVIFDLGRNYAITDIYLYIESYPYSAINNSCILDAGVPFVWGTPLHTFHNDGVAVYDMWKRVAVSTTTRYIRLRVNRNFGVIRQIGMKGIPVGLAPTVPSVTPISSTITFDQMIGVDIVAGMGIDQPAPGARNYDEYWGHIRWFSNGIYMTNGSDNVITYAQDDTTIARLISKGVKVWYNSSGAAPTMVDPGHNSGNNYTGEKPIDYTLRAGTRTIAGITTGEGVSEIPVSYAHKAWLSKKIAIHVNSRGMDEFEPENEPDIYVRGAGWMLPFELAAMMSADYDGHESTVTYLGQSVGIKNSGTSVKMIMPALAYSSIKYLRAMAFWVEHNRTDKKFPCDAINGHVYPNHTEIPPSSQGGLSPESVTFNAAQVLQDMKDFRDKWAPHAKVYQTEIGWDTYWQTHPDSLGGHFCSPTVYGDSFQFAPDISTNNPWEVQGQWIARAALLHAEKSYDRVTFFWLSDLADETQLCGTFNASGMLSLPAPHTAFVPKPAWYYIQTLRYRLKNMLFTTKTLQNVSGTDAVIHKYTHNSNSANVAYAVWFPTSTAHTASSVSIPVVLGDYQLIYPSTSSEVGAITSTHLGVTSVTVNISERPLLICTRLSGFQLYSDALTAVGRTLSGGEITAFTDFFNGISSDGLSAKILAFYLPMGTSASTSINIMNPGTYDLQFNGGTCTFTATEIQWNTAGFSYADTGFNASTGSGVANRLSISYQSSSGAANVDTVSMGASDSTNVLWLRYKQFFTSFGKMFGTEFAGADPTTGKSVLLTTNGANSKIFHNGASIASQATSGSAPNYNIWLGAANVTNFGSGFESNPMRSAHIGKELSDAEAANFNTRLNTLMTALGR